MPLCTATTSRGIRCKRYACTNLETCCAHSDDCAICLSKLGVDIGSTNTVLTLGFTRIIGVLVVERNSENLLFLLSLICLLITAC